MNRQESGKYTIVSYSIGETETHLGLFVPSHHYDHMSLISGEFMLELMVPYSGRTY